MALAAASLMAFAAAASATEVTSPKGSTYTEKFTAMGREAAVPGTKHLTVTGPLTINAQCNSHLIGKVTSQGPAATASGPLENFGFVNCTNGYSIEVTQKGTFAVHRNPATDNGTFISNGMTMDVTVPFLSDPDWCGYETKNASIATITNGKPAIVDISANLTRHAGNAFCGSTGTWEGKYEVTIPKELWIS